MPLELPVSLVDGGLSDRSSVVPPARWLLRGALCPAHDVQRSLRLGSSLARIVTYDERFRAAADGRLRLRRHGDRRSRREPSAIYDNGGSRPPLSTLAVGVGYGANCALHQVRWLVGLPLLTDAIEIRSPAANATLFIVSEQDD